MPPPAELLAAAVRRGPCSRCPTPCLRAHRSRPAALTLAPRRPAAAWPRGRLDELCRHLPCFASPLGRRRRCPPRRLGARVHGPHRAAAAASPRGPPLAAAVAGPPALRPRAAARHGACVAGLGRPPLPLTSGARWSGEGIREGDFFSFFFFYDFVVNSGCSLRNLYKIKEK